MLTTLSAVSADQSAKAQRRRLPPRRERQSALVLRVADTENRRCRRNCPFEGEHDALNRVIGQKSCAAHSVLWFSRELAPEAERSAMRTRSILARELVRARGVVAFKRLMNPRIGGQELDEVVGMKG